MNTEKTLLENENKPSCLTAVSGCALWKSTNYHQHVQEPDFIKLENGKFYEIGHRNQFGEDFVHQGIKAYNNGFFDDCYHLKPFPTHAKEIVFTIPIGEHIR